MTEARWLDVTPWDLQHPAPDPAVPPVPSAGPRTLVFCTSYAASDEVWELRYRRWVRAVRCNGLHVDQLLIVDDGSPVLPDWPDLTLVREGEPEPAEAALLLFHFRERLGRQGPTEYPGWYRSFCFAAGYAVRRGFQRIVHIESDAFIISARMAEFVNGVGDGWLGFSMLRSDMPESAIQIIAGDAVARFAAFAQTPYAEYSGRAIEMHLPYSRVVEHFVGARYGQYISYIPRNADFSVQVYPPAWRTPQYFWWMEGGAAAPPVDAAATIQKYARSATPGAPLPGAIFRHAVSQICTAIDARAFLQIGDGLGDVTDEVLADVIWLDAKRGQKTEPPAVRLRTFLFNAHADRFFGQHRLGDVIGGQLDVALFGGRQLVEQWLRNFIAVEAACRPTSCVILPDCLPLNPRMAERSFRVDESEPAWMRGFWTGDVWKLLPILHRYRPDLRIFTLDCSPCGLVCCSNLDPQSGKLAQVAAQALDEMEAVDLAGYGLERLWTLFPMLDSRRLLADRQAIADLFGQF